MALYVATFIIVIIFIYIFIMFNSFIRLNNRVKEAFSTMDVYLKKRWDLIPNLVETVKGYTKHENNFLTSVINLRNKTYNTMSLEEKLITNEELVQEINKIMILAEKYPDLKASENFKDLSKQLVKIEDDIANSRKYYNGTVRIYNNKVEMFPNNLLAKLFGYEPKKMFETRENERENIQIKL